MSKKTEKQANRILDFDDDREFWKQGAASTVVAIHSKLKKKGLTEDESKEVISAIWSACAEEYGD